MFVVLETRIDTDNFFPLKKLGFDNFDSTEIRGFVGVITMGWDSNKIKVPTVEKHFQYRLATISPKKGKD